MSRRRKLKRRVHQLQEIRNIMDAMKNLAVLETHKLSIFLENQEALIRDLERVADDFFGFYPYPVSRGADETDCWILFGSERGFNGDFNETLLEQLDRHIASSADRPYLLVPVGNKLFTKLRDDPHVTQFIEGADVAEEINTILNTLVLHINSLQSEHGVLNVFVLFHDAQTEEVTSRQLMPPFRENTGKAPAYAYPPLLNIPPEEFFSELFDRYLFVALQEISYTSLMAENHKRIQHMTGAVQKLDEKTEELLRKYHIRRQEEITEEIEVILLNATVEPAGG